MGNALLTVMDMAKKPKKWIKVATSDKGALHRHLGVPEGEKIPADKLESATHSDNPKIRKEANLAMTLKGMSKKKPKPKDHLTGMYGAKK